MPKLAHVSHGAIDAFPVLDPALAAKGIKLADCFHADYLAACHQAPDEAAIGWATADGGVSFAPAAAPAMTAAELAAYAQGAWRALLVKGQTFNVAAAGSPVVEVLCDGTNDTRADLALLALFGQANPGGTKTWLDNTGHTTALTGAQLVTLATLAGNWVADTYPALSTLLGEVASGAVTTAEQVDAFAWPTS